MAKTRTKDQQEFSMISIDIKNARLLLDTIYEGNVERSKMKKIANKQELVRFIDELEAMIDSSGKLTLTAFMSVN